MPPCPRPHTAPHVYHAPIAPFGPLGPHVHVHHPSYGPPGMYGPPGAFFPGPPGLYVQRGPPGRRVRFHG
jgi:hypothetical protein